MSDHHQHSVLIARPPKRSARPTEQHPATGPATAPESPAAAPKLTASGKFFAWMFGDRTTPPRH